VGTGRKTSRGGKWKIIPIDYADFEGIIPKANMVVAAVMVWDQAPW